MRVLLVESDLKEGRMIEQVLRNAQFQVYHTDLGEEGIDLATLYDYHAIVLELALKDMPGQKVLETIKMRKVKTPVLAMSTGADLDARIQALKFADYYLPKPVHPDELVAALHAVVRRMNGYASSVLAMGNVEIDLHLWQAKVNGEVKHLTGREFEMLRTLMLAKGKVLSTEKILEDIWGNDDLGCENTVSVYIGKVRRKVADPDGRTIIKTIRGRGYLAVPFPEKY